MERLATVPEVEGQVQRRARKRAFLGLFAICHKANSSSLKRTVRKGRKAPVRRTRQIIEEFDPGSQ